MLPPLSKQLTRLIGASATGQFLPKVVTNTASSDFVREFLGCYR